MNIPAAIIVCGGQSSRMGRPKASLEFGPERLLQRIVRQVGEAAHPIVVVAARGQRLPDLPETVRVVLDAVEGRGPLEALAAGLDALGPDVTLAYVTSTDAPFLAPGWIGHLAEQIGAADAAIPVVDRQSHPLSALYRVATVGPVVRSLLDRDVLRLKALLSLIQVHEIGADALRAIDPDLSTLINVNTQEEYESALAAAFPQKPIEGF